MAEQMNEHAERQATLKLHKVKAVQEAMFEVINENQGEIVKRSKAKLIAQGFSIAEVENESQI